MSELIDTTEMYLRTLYELLEEGIDLRRARIVDLGSADEIAEYYEGFSNATLWPL